MKSDEKGDHNVDDNNFIIWSEPELGDDNVYESDKEDNWIEMRLHFFSI